MAVGARVAVFALGIVVSFGLQDPNHAVAEVKGIVYRNRGMEMGVDRYWPLDHKRKTVEPESSHCGHELDQIH